MAQRPLPVLESQSEPEFPSNGHSRLENGQWRVLVRVQLLWDNRRLLGRLAAIGFVVSIVVALLIPPKYESVAQLMPPNSDTPSTALLAAIAGKGGDPLSGYATNLLGIKSSGALFIGILHSRTVQDSLVNKFDLRKYYGVRHWQDARRVLDERTNIAEERKSGIISIRVQDRSPQRAQAMAQAYVDELNIAVATLSTSSARREREFLETRLKAVKQELDQAAQDFSQFASKNTAIDLTVQGKAMVEAAARLQGELIAAEAQRQGLEQIYTPNNARVRAVQGNIDELRRQLNKLGGAGTSDQKANNSSNEDSIYPSIRQLPLLGVTYADLFRRNKIEETVYESLTKQYELAKVEEAKEIPTVKVLDPANYPEGRSSPQRTLIVGLGTAVCFVFGCAWLLGCAVWSEIEPEDPRKLLMIRVVDNVRQDYHRIKLWTGKSVSSKSTNGFETKD